MVKPPFVDKDGVKKGAWNEEEDYKLRTYIQRFGHWNWRLLPKYAGLARSGKSCRLRWVNYLKPGVKRGNYSKEEVDLIMELHAELGNKWSAIAKKLPGRTDNDIKNYWHAHVKKRNRRNAAAISQIEQQLCEASPLSEISHEQQHNLIFSEVNCQDESAPKDLAEAESSYLRELENLVPSLNNTTRIAHDDNTNITWDSGEGNFWSELCPITYLESSTEMNYDDFMSRRYWLAENSTFSSYAVAETQESFWTELERGLFSPSF